MKGKKYITPTGLIQSARALNIPGRFYTKFEYIVRHLENIDVIHPRNTNVYYAQEYISSVVGFGVTLRWVPVSLEITEDQYRVIGNEFKNSYSKADSAINKLNEIIYTVSPESKKICNRRKNSRIYSTEVSKEGKFS